MTAPAWKLSPSQKDDVLRRAGAGETLTRIAASYGVTRQAIRGILNRRGVPARAVGKLSETERTEAVQRYADGASVAQVAAMYGVTQPSIRSLVMRRGVHRQAVHTLRHDAFDQLTAEAKYWIGFLFADGTVNYRPGHLPHVGVHLSARDREHLVALREFMGASNRVSPGGTQRDACQFSVRSEQLARRLVALGRYDGPINQHLVTCRHFWRGVVDGDGSIGLYARPGPRKTPMPQFRLVREHRLLEAFRSFLVTQGICGLSVRPHKSIYNIGTTCKPAQRIVALLYADATVALHRKAETARQVLALGGGSDRR